MNGERWSKAKAIFDAALDYDTSERPLVVERLADGDAELEREVNSLLLRHRRRSTLLDASEPTASMTHPKRVGADRVVRPVGNGGAGIVYEARRADDQFHQRVAIKLLHPTAATEAAVQRFRRERQLLASLEHPNLTRLIDGGVTSDGFPYLVMEFVEGEPLLAYCNRVRKGIRERLDLFLVICETVEYAHSRLVVHRDIKPSNVLVDGEGRPRLLDFGIAKLLDAIPGEDRTATGFGAFTPAYASPEQIRGEVPAVSMDIYALGVLLFELLTGRHPLGEAATANEWVNRVFEAKPARLSEIAASGVRQELKGDLEAICAKAMQKESVYRYPGVRALTDDIRAHLEGRPIAARKAQTAYVLRRFLNRNAVPVGAGLLVVVSLGTSLVMVKNESRRAERSYAAARRSLNAILAEAARRDIPASTRRAMLSTASEYIELLDEESRRDADAAEERIEIAYHLAGLYGEAFASNLGEFDRAEQITKEAIHLARSAAARFPKDARFVQSEAMGWMMLGDILVGRKRWGEALEAFGHAQKNLERVPVVKGMEDKRVTDLSVIASMRGDILLEQGEAEAALAIQEKVLQTRTELARRSGSQQAIFGVASVQLSRGNALLSMGRAAEAAEAFAEAKENFGTVSAVYEDPSYARQSRVVATLRLGDALAKLGRNGVARTLWTGALPEAERLYQEDSQSALALGNLNEVRRRLGFSPQPASIPSIPDPRLPAVAGR